ncbi:MAG: hypothetical protein WAL38_12675, partial [Solirubrobacteraceae bacterium]
MKQLIDHLRRHIRLSAAVAVIVLAAVVTFAVRGAGPAHAAAGTTHARPSSTAVASAAPLPGPA